MGNPHGFSEASPSWVQAVTDMLGFAILVPSANPQTAAQPSMSPADTERSDEQALVRATPALQ